MKNIERDGLYQHIGDLPRLDTAEHCEFQTLDLNIHKLYTARPDQKQQPALFTHINSIYEFLNTPAHMKS